MEWSAPTNALLGPDSARVLRHVALVHELAVAVAVSVLTTTDVPFGRATGVAKVTSSVEEGD